MKRKLFLPIILGSVLFLGGCSYYGNQNAGAPASSSQKQSQSAQTETTANAVTIQNFAFSPASLTIKVGTTVTWTNKDSVTHTVNSATFNSGNIAPREKFQFTFSSPGTYAYSCGIHPSMKGTIVVQ